MLHIQKHLELVCVIRATVENYVCIENLSQKGRNPNYNLDTVHGVNIMDRTKLVINAFEKSDFKCS